MRARLWLSCLVALCVAGVLAGCSGTAATIAPAATVTSTALPTPTAVPRLPVSSPTLQSVLPTVTPAPTPTTALVSPTAARLATAAASPATPATPANVTPRALPVTLEGNAPATFAVLIPPGLITLKCTYQGKDILSVDPLDPQTRRSVGVSLLVGCPGTASAVFASDPGTLLLDVKNADGPYRLELAPFEPAELTTAAALPRKFTGSGSRYLIVAIAAPGAVQFTLDVRNEAALLSIYTSDGQGLYSQFILGLANTIYSLTFPAAGTYLINVSTAGDWTFDLGR